VGDEEAGQQRAELRIGQLQLGVLHALGQRRDDPPVEVVEQIDQGEDSEPGAG
jgi:hypothetical protein